MDKSSLPFLNEIIRIPLNMIKFITKGFLFIIIVMSLLVYRFLKAFLTGLFCLFYPIIFLIYERQSSNVVKPKKGKKNKQKAMKIDEKGKTLPLTIKQQEKGQRLQTMQTEKNKNNEIERVKKEALINQKNIQKEEKRKKKIDELTKKRQDIIKKRELQHKESLEQKYLQRQSKNIDNASDVKHEISVQIKNDKNKIKNEKYLQRLDLINKRNILINQQKELKRQQKARNKLSARDKGKEELIVQKNKLRQEKEQLKEEQRLQKLELYKQKKIEKQQVIEKKERIKEQNQLEKIKRGKELKKRLSDKYENENIQKPSSLNTLSKTINQIPKNIKAAIIAKYNSLTIVKNIKNKRDINRQALLISFEGDDAKKSDEKLTYQYVAKDPNGKVVRDYFDAYSKVEVHSFLLSEGYEVYSIKTSSVIQILNGGFQNKKIKQKDLVFFLTQLSTYIKAGISLIDALKILSRQYKKKSYQKIFRTIIYDLTMGENFSQSLEKQEKSFPKLLINMVKAAEMTGDLAETLDDMAEYYTETEKTRKQMFTALLYPTIILVVAVAVLSFIMIYIIPKFVSIYESMDVDQIPSITLMVLGFSDFMQKYYLFLFIGFVGLVILIKLMFAKMKIFRAMLQWFMMHIPVFGQIIIYNEVTMFTKTFSSLLRHNVFITDSMEILNKITNNEIYKMLIIDTITNLARGDKISLAFKDHWAFPVPAYEMIVTGEKTGQLAEMMAKVSSYYQEMHKNLVVRMKTFIEPILIVFLTVVVGIIILSIVVPMFNMYSVIQMQ
ncbi:MAG: type II secretion system F family protein [Bacilli bacterium]